MGSGASKSKPEWYPGEPTTTEALLDDECSCDPAMGLGSSGGLGAATGTTAATTSSQKNGGRFDTREAREITRLPLVELTDMEFIANGAFCSVFACKYKGWSVVAKRVRADLPLTERRAALANMWTEYDCLRPLDHPNVIDVYGMCRVKCRDGYCDWNEKDVCLLLEQLALGTVGHLFGTTYDVEKNLSTALARSRKMKMVPFRCRLDRALELALALEYVHGGAGVGTMMHRDIKSVNVGFALNGSLKLMDFGLSKVVAPDGAPENDTYQMTGAVGSYRYMAPELVRHEPYNAKADIYSWAILSWEVLSVSRPYTGITESSFIKRVVMDGHRPELRKSWPERLRALLASAWHADYSKRPTAAEIVRVLEAIKANLPEREQRRPSTTAPSFGNASNSRRNSRTQRSVSAPGSICHARRPSAHSGGGGGGGGGGGDVSPAASPAQKRFSFPLSRGSPAANRRWSFAAKASSTPRHHQASSSGSSSTSRAGKESPATTTTTTETKTKKRLPMPSTPALSAATSMATNMGEDSVGTTGVANDSRSRRPSDRESSSTCCCHHHQEGGTPSQRETIAKALAQEAEDAQQEALAQDVSAQQEAAARAARYQGRTAAASSGRVAERERSYAEHQARSSADSTGVPIGAGVEGSKRGGSGAGSRGSAGKDDIVDDVAPDPSKATITREVSAPRVRRDSSVETAAEEVPARDLRYGSSQETAEDVPAASVSRRRHSNSQEIAGEIPARVRRHSSLVVKGGGGEKAAARESRHTSLEPTPGEVAAGLNHGSSLSKLWPSKSNWSLHPEDASSSSAWAWRGGRNRSVGSPAAPKTIFPGDENGGDGRGLEDRPAAMSAGAAAAGGRPFAAFSPTGGHDFRKTERPVKSSKNPRAYTLETNVFNPLERAPL